MEEGFKNRLMRVVTASLFMIVAVGGLIMVYPTYRRTQALRRHESEMQNRIEAKKKEIAALIDNQRRFRTDADFVESIARQNRRVFPGELVFIFEDD